MSEEQQPVFRIEKIYVKGLSLEIPNAPAVFLEREPPQVDVQLHTAGERIDEGMFGVLLTATVTAKVNDKTMFWWRPSRRASFKFVMSQRPRWSPY